MQQGGDDSAQYYLHHYPISLPNANPNPNPAEFPPLSNPIQSPFASAPPYSHYPASEFPNYAPPYPPYSQNPDPIPNLVPSYSQPQCPHSQQSFNPPPFPQEPLPPSAPEPVLAPAPCPHFQQPYYPSYDSHQPAANYGPSSNPSPFPHPSYERPYENPARFDQGSGYFSENPGGRYGFGPEIGDDGLRDGVYAYDGGKVEPNGARGTGGFGMSSSSSNAGSGLKFDDYGRSLGPGPGPASSAKDQPKIVRAVPKMESQQDVKNGVQKYRVKLLPEGASVTTTDVLCQIGLDGIHMLDPSTNRTLRIYPLENVTRWEVLDSSIFAFWSKSPVDIEPRRIRLQSNSYTTSTILDTVTAATVQLEEVSGNNSLLRSKGSIDASKPAEQTTEKKKGIVDWMNLIKPGNEEKDHWVPDEAISKCTSCATDFGAFVRKHHCRNCGDIFCDKCTQGRIALTVDEQAQPVRVCDGCMLRGCSHGGHIHHVRSVETPWSTTEDDSPNCNKLKDGETSEAEVSQRFSSAKESVNKSTAMHNHEDLARKLQEEMERNRKSSSGSKSSDGSGGRMREVACPICTVHLQVQVPTSGSETIECGVCQHPFLVSAH